MDTLFFPQTNRKEKRMSWYSFRFRSIPGEMNLQFGGFLYIGKQSSCDERLAQIYGKGLIAETIGQAESKLLGILAQDDRVLPEVIVCDACFRPQAIGEFCNFLRQHSILKAVPFVLDGSFLDKEAIGLFRKHARPDEIVFLNRLDEASLGSKVRFLRKFKESSHRSIEPQIEESHPENHPLAFGFGSKRVFDIMIACLALLVLSPLFVLIAVAIAVESRGPIFYVAKRAGRGYRIFNFYKFRTMVQDADKKVGELTHLNQYAASGDAVFFKISNDPRITRVGRLLRNTSLDELPQLFNMLLGDMSLVGNRPLPLYEAAKLTTDDYAGRFMAPAGITGLWQVKKRGSKEMSVEERISIDIDYATRCSFATDLWIICNTPSALLQKENV
jgi:lipopolysaccharide/colanic/teichoic acid biosynthesis glycosyltransferase